MEEKGMDYRIVPLLKPVVNNAYAMLIKNTLFFNSSFSSELLCEIVDSAAMKVSFSKQGNVFENSKYTK